MGKEETVTAVDYKAGVMTTVGGFVKSETPKVFDDLPSIRMIVSSEIV